METFLYFCYVGLGMGLVQLGAWELCGFEVFIDLKKSIAILVAGIILGCYIASLSLGWVTYITCYLLLVAAVALKHRSCCAE